MEITPDGEVDTIGEIAHIISRSPDGPRGDDILPVEKRNDYSNLILLCPTHHSEIDKFIDNWPATRIHKIKNDHEKWVSGQLQQGIISYKPVDNSEYIETIRKSWKNFASAKVWINSCLTPLSIEGECVDPLENRIIETVNNIQLPNGIYCHQHINHYDTRPDENGLVNQNLSEIDNGCGYKVSIFRNGHCGISICIEASVKQITGNIREEEPGFIKSTRVIRYTHLAEVIIHQIKALKNIWSKCLLFKNMSLTFDIINTNDTLLYSTDYGGRMGSLYGFPVEKNHLAYSLVIDREMDENIIMDLVLKRFANYFGLILDQIYTDKGKISCPKRLKS